MWRLRKSFTEPGDEPQLSNSRYLEQEIASARIALENISRLLESISPRDSRRRSGYTYLILTAVCSILCIGSILFTINAFTDVQPAENGASVEILISGGGNTVGLLTRYEAGKTIYQLYFPDHKGPLKWALVLIGPAMLSNVDRSPQAVNQFSQYRTGTCASGVGDNPGSQVTAKCQVFYGSFNPSELPGVDIQRDFSACGPSSNLFPALSVGSVAEAPDVVVSGTSGAAAGESPLAKVITLPLLTQPSARIEDGIYPVGSIQDLAVGEITAAVGCDTITVPNGYEISDAIPAPDFQDSFASYWTAKGNSGSPSVAVKRTWAGAAANVGVIAAGIFFTLSAVFLPLWLQTRQRPLLTRRS